MRFIFKLTIVFLSLSLQAQFSDLFLDDFHSPNHFHHISKPSIFTSTEVIDLNHQLKKDQITILTFYNNRQLRLSYQQYGYRLFSDRKISLSSKQNLHSDFAIGLNSNFHYLSIKGYEKHKTLSFDIGLIYLKERTHIEIFIENPFNAQYLDSELDSRLIIKSFNRWNKQLYSAIQIQESVYYGTKINHRLIYTYSPDFTIGIIQSIRPYELGLWMTYRKHRYSIFSQIKKLPWTNSFKLAISYTLSK